jgi:hypothetical protein
MMIDIYLFMQARTRYRTAYSMLTHSIADGTIDSATLSDRLPSQPALAGALQSNPPGGNDRQ